MDNTSKHAKIIFSKKESNIMKFSQRKCKQQNRKQGKITPSPQFNWQNHSQISNVQHFYKSWADLYQI